MTSHEQSPALDVPTAVRALRGLGPVVALESTLPTADRGGASFVAGAPLALFEWHRGRGRVLPLRDEGALLADVVLPEGRPFHALQAVVDAMHRSDDREAGSPSGAFGFFGYETTAPPELPRLEPWPDAWFLLTDCVLEWPAPGAAPRLWESDARRGDALRAAMQTALQSRARTTLSGPRVDPPTPLDVTSPADFSPTQYAAAFAASRAALRRGDSYQLCFTYPLRRGWRGDPLEIHERLRVENPAPFAAYVETPQFAIASSSPERFLRVDPDGRVEARPMKGTAARPEEPAARAAAIRALVDSAKTRAENLMIADLLRNDLGRVCRIGSVRVTEPLKVEEYATLLQLVSVVEGQLRRSCTGADLLASAFPPGSMTGAPKIRSIEILRQLEIAPRGPYGGALGCVRCDGRIDLAVVIRSVLVASGEARVNVGGGILWGSEESAEFAESRAKAQRLLEVLGRCGATELAP